MTDLNEMDLFTTPTTEPTHVGERAKCVHPKPLRTRTEDGGWACGRCPKVVTGEAVKRGRSSRRHGNDFEREIAKRLGMPRVGQYGGPDDNRNALFAAQAKCGEAFPERLYRWLRQVPVDAGQTPLLVIADSPGPGHKRRALVVLDIDDWRALHGSETEEVPA